ncbi:MAG: ABC transporter permease [Phaeodactylibacter sp.]|nr:ABC transporter permease [Phaeodactylibacter sp.]
MLKNHLLIAFRALMKYRGNTAIHVLGLSMGLACCLLIYTFIQYHRSFDRHHEKAGRIYRVGMIDYSGGEKEMGGNTPYPLAVALRNDFSDWEQVARTHTEREVLVGLPDGRKFEGPALFAEPEWLDIFDFKTVEGDPRYTLSQPGQVVLCRSAAQRYFGDEEAIGKTFELDGELALSVGAVVEDIPATSHLRGDMLVAYASLKDYFPLDTESWGMVIGGSTYVLLSGQTDAVAIQEQLPGFISKYYDEDEAAITEFVLQPLLDIHFNTDFEVTGGTPGIDARYLWFFGAIGLMILLVACINFINLSTAHAFRRAREIAVRKVIGAERRQLVMQFLTEAFLISAAGAIIAALLGQLALSHLNALLGLQMKLSWAADPAPGVFLLCSVLLVTLLAGAYPAFIISGFRPVNALKGKVGESLRGTLQLRRGLVVGQFCISILLLIGTLVVSRQLHYFQNQPLGFRQEAILVVNLPEPGVYPAMKEEWLQHPGVEEACFSFGAPTSRGSVGTRLYPEPGNERTAIDFVFKAAEHNFDDLFELDIIAGRELQEADDRRATPEDPEAEGQYNILVNEQMVKKLGFEQVQDVIGKQYELGINHINATIVGVVRDFNLKSLHHSIEPVVIMHFPHFYYGAALKIQMNKPSEAIAHIEQAWSRQFPKGLFKYDFLDDTIAQLYQEESRLSSLFQLFAGLAIFIACLGLWGLVAFITQQRTREVGVRKVLGASVAQIIILLTREFTWLVGFAFLIAAPLAWWGAQKWLANFPYHTHLDAWIFLGAGGLVLLAAWLTVGFKAVRAALANPVKALRSE